MTLLSLLAPLSLVAVWAHDEIADTDRFVDTVTPLAKDPAVQEAVTQLLTRAITEHLDAQAVTRGAVEALVDAGLSPSAASRLDALAAPLAQGIDRFVEDQVRTLVSSQEFARAWERANREAHGQMVAVLTGEGGAAVTVDEGAVRLDLAVVIDAVRARLLNAGFTLVEDLPPVTAEFTLLQSADLVKAQRGFRLLDALARALPVAAVLLFTVAIAASRRRRRTVVVASLCVAGSMLLLGLGINLARSFYLDAVPPARLPGDAAAAMFDQLVHFMRLNLRAVLVLFLAVAATAWVTGPGAAASRARLQWLAPVSRSDDEALSTGPISDFVTRNRTVLRGAVGGGAALVYAMAENPTGAKTLGLLGVTGALLLALELIGRRRVAPTG